MEFLADRRPRARRGADGDARQPRPAGRPVRRAPPRGGRGPRERGAQAGDARRGAGRRDHDRRAAGGSSRSTPRSRRSSATGPTTLIGRELGAALVPPPLRERHRDGLARGTGKLLGKRVEITALHADGREFPVELTITRIDVPGPPMYTGYVRDITDRVERERELRASRARIVAAADEARRRLERDLHDGAQNRLLAVGLELKVLQTDCRPRPRRACARSCGSPPTSCASSRAASTPRCSPSSAWSPRCARWRGGRRCRSRSRYDAERRFPAAGRGRRVLPRRRGADQRRPLRERDPRRGRVVDGTRWTIEIADDGAGGADPAAGSGLRGMADRLAALDGTLAVDSPPGGGTRVRG